MTCYFPLTAWRSRDLNETRMVFSSEKGLPGTRVQLPCGQCIGCRLDRARKWAVRCMHEKSMHKENCFLTLTYSDDNIPPNGSLNKRDVVLFLKRLRRKYGSGIRFFQCGEYGERLMRPHHHMLVFGFNFSDRKLFSIRNGVRLYTSLELQELWPHGFSTIGDVTFDSACYVARYITKKITGDKKNDHYRGRVEEYITMSRRPGIGGNWYKKYKEDIYSYDRLVVAHKHICRPGRYYDSLFDHEYPDRFAEIKKARKARIASRGEIEQERLDVMHECVRLKFDKLTRSYEQGD